MLRNILAVITGILSSGIIIILVEGLSPRLFEVPRITNQQELEAFIKAAPAVFHLFILLAYALGSFGGGLAASFIAKDKKQNRAMTVGGIAMGFGVFNLVSLHHPMWVILMSMIAFLPFSYLGSRLGIKWSTTKEEE